jgi:poly-gamma-glutamate capsule biosynthesis protein CapA/YwtB (metallophosphatase superfamily)
MKAAGIKTAGAGSSLAEASLAAVIEATPGCRVLVFGFGTTSSGISPNWAAQAERAGVRLLPDLSRKTAEALAAEVLARKERGGITVISAHWGPNWGYDITPEQRTFAHALIDLAACDILHGHSSHHPMAMEIYRGRLILYGCGDFINDYEGIRGHEEYRGDLSVMYLPRLSEANGELKSLTLVLFKKKRFRLQSASVEDAKWFQAAINSQSRKFATQILLKADGILNAEPVKLC